MLSELNDFVVVVFLDHVPNLSLETQSSECFWVKVQTFHFVFRVQQGYWAIKEPMNLHVLSVAGIWTILQLKRDAGQERFN